jgi:hypothetical protein
MLNINGHVLLIQLAFCILNPVADLQFCKGTSDSRKNRDGLYGTLAPAANTLSTGASFPESSEIFPADFRR